MSIENSKVIDLTGIEENGDLVLTITDHLTWDDEKEHLLMLQEKLNTYLAYLESEQYLENYPDIEGSLIIEVLSKYSLSDLAVDFYRYVRKVIREAGFDLKFSILKGDEKEQIIF